MQVHSISAVQSDRLRQHQRCCRAQTDGWIIKNWIHQDFQGCRNIAYNLEPLQMRHTSVISYYVMHMVRIHISPGKKGGDWLASRMKVSAASSLIWLGISAHRVLLWEVSQCLWCHKCKVILHTVLWKIMRRAQGKYTKKTTFRVVSHMLTLPHQFYIPVSHHYHLQRQVSLTTTELRQHFVANIRNTSVNCWGTEYVFFYMRVS